MDWIKPPSTFGSKVPGHGNNRQKITATIIFYYFTAHWLNMLKRVYKAVTQQLHGHSGISVVFLVSNFIWFT